MIFLAVIYNLGCPLGEIDTGKDCWNFLLDVPERVFLERLGKWLSVQSGDALQWLILIVNWIRLRYTLVTGKRLLLGASVKTFLVTINSGSLRWAKISETLNQNISLLYSYSDEKSNQYLYRCNDTVQELGLHMGQKPQTCTLVFLNRWNFHWCYQSGLPDNLVFRSGLAPATLRQFPGDF